MKALFVVGKTVEGKSAEVVINLDLCSLIEYEPEGPTLDFWLEGRSVLRFLLPPETKEYHVMDKLKMAMFPLYEGRMNNVLGIKLTLDLLSWGGR